MAVQGRRSGGRRCDGGNEEAVRERRRRTAAVLDILAVPIGRTAGRCARGLLPLLPGVLAPGAAEYPENWNMGLLHEHCCASGTWVDLGDAGVTVYLKGR